MELAELTELTGLTTELTELKAAARVTMSTSKGTLRGHFVISCMAFAVSA
jgi:hypothetical protein